MGWQTEVIPILIAGNTIIINSQGELVYTGGVKLGDLIASIANSAAQDSVGNLFPAGIASLLPVSPGPSGTPLLVAQLYQGSVNFGSLAAVELQGGKTPASVFGLSTDGQLTMYSGTLDNVDNPANMTLESQENSGFGQPLLTINQAVRFIVFNGNLPTGAGPYVYVSGAGTLQASTSGGVHGTIPMDVDDTTDNANSNNGTQPLTASFTIPAGEANIGSIYEIEVPFNGTFQTASLAFKPALNGASIVTSGGDALASTFFGAGTGFTGWVKLIARIKTLGVSGTVDYFITGGVGANAAHTAIANSNSGAISSQSTGMPIDTTSANTLRVNSVWGSSVAAQTVTGHGSKFTRTGA